MSATTTLNRIRAHSPCAEGWTKLLAQDSVRRMREQSEGEAP